MDTVYSYSFSPLGDRALLIDFGNRIEKEINEIILGLFDHFENNPIEGVKGMVPAYSSLALYYDPVYFAGIRKDDKTLFETVVEKVNEKIERHTDAVSRKPMTIKVPFCYSKRFAWDLENVAASHQLPVEKVIEIFTARTYRVFMIGFLPGFGYMGEVDNRIATPRKSQPRSTVPAGSVGIAGNQTGIYPVDSPGGWNIIGRTPLSLFNKNDQDPAMFHPGDEIVFYPISENEFENYKGRHI